MTLLLYISLILLLAAHLFHDLKFGNKHDFKSDMVLLAVFLLAEIQGLLIGHYWGAVTYFCLRVAFFDIGYGWFAKRDIFYLGDGIDDSETDKINREIPNNLRVTAWIIAFLASIYINFEIYEKLI